MFVKRLVSAFFCGIFAVSAIAATPSVVVVSTCGPDQYASGQVVADGESYLVVGLKAGHYTFGGLTFDGKLCDPENNIILAEVPAKGGRLEPIAVSVSAAHATALAGGSCQVVLLDTRSGSDYLPRGLKGGIHGYGLSTTYDVAMINTVGREIRLIATAEIDTVITPGALPAPVIKSIEVIDGGRNVRLVIGNTSPLVRYHVKSGDEILSEKEIPAEVTPKVLADGTVEVIVPANEASQFFEATRAPLK